MQSGRSAHIGLSPSGEDRLTCPSPPRPRLISLVSPVAHSSRASSGCRRLNRLTEPTQNLASSLPAVIDNGHSDKHAPVTGNGHAWQLVGPESLPWYRPSVHSVPLAPYASLGLLLRSPRSPSHAPFRTMPLCLFELQTTPSCLLRRGRAGFPMAPCSCRSGQEKGSSGHG